MVTAPGSRPACSAASRTALIVHAVMSGSASWRMKPSPTSPVESQGPWPVAGDPHTEPARRRPREAQGGALVLDLPAVGQLADDVHRLAQRVDRRRLAVGDTYRRVAAADAAHGAVAVHLVERGEHTRRDRPISCRRVGDHRPDHDVPGLGEDPAVDDVGLLPQQVAVERPDVAESVGLGALGEVDDTRRRRRRLQHQPEIHLDRRSVRSGAAPATRS